MTITFKRVYIRNYASLAMQHPIVHAYEMHMLRNTTKARGDNSLNFSIKLSETSPPLASIAKMGEKLRRSI